MIRYARLTPGPGFKPISAALYYAQRLLVQPHLRRATSKAIAYAIARRQGFDRRSGLSPLVDAACAAGIRAIGEDGLAFKPIPVSASEADEICIHFRDKQAFAPSGQPVDIGRAPYVCSTATYQLDDILDCRRVLELINAPDILRIAAAYLGCKPTLSSLGVRWSLPRPGPASTVQHFHRDTDDWRFLKMFVYLTDVDLDSGPHVYIVGSHKTRGRWRARSYDERLIERTYGKRNTRTVVGPRGTSFIADTHGIHMGAVPTARPRLILQAEYSLLPVFAYSYERPRPPSRRVSTPTSIGCCSPRPAWRRRSRPATAPARQPAPTRAWGPRSGHTAGVGPARRAAAHMGGRGRSTVLLKNQAPR